MIGGEPSQGKIPKGQNDDGEEDLHVILETTTPIDKPAIKAALGPDLAGYLRAHIHAVAILPRTPTGKVLREAARRAVLA